LLAFECIEYDLIYEISYYLKVIGTAVKNIHKT